MGSVAELMADLAAMARPRHPKPTGERIGLIGDLDDSGTLQVLERFDDGRWRAQPAIRYSWTAVLDAGVGELVTNMIGLGEVCTADRADRSITASNGFGERRAYIRTIGEPEGYSR